MFFMSKNEAWLRGFMCDSGSLLRLVKRNGIVIIIDGRIAGIWKRTFKKGAILITLSPFTSLTETENEAVTKAANQYGTFLEMPVVLEWV
jgi:hypothetical protein